MKLASYLTENGISHRAFAERINTSQASVTRYAIGARTPRLEMIARIHNATNGRVSYEDFVRSGLASEAAE